jgi:hypothetical protein
VGIEEKHGMAPWGNLGWADQGRSGKLHTLIWSSGVVIMPRKRPLNKQQLKDRMAKKAKRKAGNKITLGIDPKKMKKALA